MIIRGRRIEAIIFDIDGTLVDSLPVYYSVFNRGIQRYNLDPVSDEFLSNSLRRGENIQAIFRKIFPPDTDDSIIAACRSEIVELFKRAEANEVKPFPGIHELFKNLKAKAIKVGVATGRMSLPEIEWERFRGYGLGDLIESIVTSREVERRKPAPDAILECAARLKVPIANCLVVGDTDIDIIAARTAGALSVALASTEGDMELLNRENPDLLFPSLIDLDSFLSSQP